MKKQPIIRILLIAVIALSTVFMVAAFRTTTATVTAEEECIIEDRNDCPESNTQSEFFLQSLTRTLLDG